MSNKAKAWVFAIILVTLLWGLLFVAVYRWVQ